MIRSTIAAIQLLAGDDLGEGMLGLFTQLPVDTPLIVCGEGTTENTVRVQFNGSSYLVFRQDMERARKEKSQHATA